jgi:hypothetical protein
MLIAIKLPHTVIWVGFVGCIAAIPVSALQARFDAAAIALGIVLIEVVVLALNGGRCPLRSIAAAHTSDQRAIFDIYLPAWRATPGRSSARFTAAGS